MVKLDIEKINYRGAKATEHETKKEEAVSDIEQVGYAKRKKGRLERLREYAERAKPVAEKGAGLLGGLVGGAGRSGRRVREREASGGFDLDMFGMGGERKRKSGGFDITNLPDLGTGSSRSSGSLLDISDPFSVGSPRRAGRRRRRHSKGMGKNITIVIKR